MATIFDETRWYTNPHPLPMLDCVMRPNSLCIPFLSKIRQQSCALIFACYATLNRANGGVTKYFVASSEEKTGNDQDFDTDCRCPPRP